MSMNNPETDLSFLTVHQGTAENRQNAAHMTDMEGVKNVASLIQFIAESLDRHLLEEYGQVLPDREWRFYE